MEKKSWEESLTICDNVKLSKKDWPRTHEGDMRRGGVTEG